MRRVRSWYAALGDALRDARTPPPTDDDDDPDRYLRVLSDARQTAVGGAGTGASNTLALLWAAEHLDNLRALELQLVGPAGELAGGPARSLRI